MHSSLLVLKSFKNEWRIQAEEIWMISNHENMLPVMSIQSLSWSNNEILLYLTDENYLTKKIV